LENAGLSEKGHHDRSLQHAATSETGMTAHQVLDAATELSKNGERLRTEVDAFIANVRAA